MTRQCWNNRGLIQNTATNLWRILICFVFLYVVLALITAQQNFKTICTHLERFSMFIPLLNLFDIQHYYWLWTTSNIYQIKKQYKTNGFAAIWSQELTNSIRLFLWNKYLYAVNCVDWEINIQQIKFVDGCCLHFY